MQGVDGELELGGEQELLLELELYNVPHKYAGQCFHIHGHRLSLLLLWK